MRHKEKRGTLPMNLQFFASSTSDNVDTETENVDGGAGIGGDGDSESSKDKTFDDILTDTNHQAEFDRRVQEAVAAAKEKWDALMNDKLSEAEKLAKMNKEEKAQYQQQKKEKELATKEAAITRRELMAEAKNTLVEKKLPVSLAEVLNYTDADSCNASIAAVEKAFQTAVESAVEERLKGGKPPKKAKNETEVELEKQVESLMMGIV